MTAYIGIFFSEVKRQHWHPCNSLKNVGEGQEPWCPLGITRIKTVGQEACCKFEAIIVYQVNPLLVWATEPKTIKWTNTTEKKKTITENCWNREGTPAFRAHWVLWLFKPMWSFKVGFWHLLVLKKLSISAEVYVSVFVSLGRSITLCEYFHYCGYYVWLERKILTTWENLLEILMQHLEEMMHLLQTILMAHQKH